MPRKRKKQVSAPRTSANISTEMTHKSIPLVDELGNMVVEEVAGALGGMVMGQFIELIIPSDDSEFFDRIYRNVAKVVDRALDRQARKNISFALENIMRFLRNDYASSRRTFTKADPGLKNKDYRNELTKMLQKRQEQYVSGDNGMMTRLMHPGDPGAAKAAFTLFLLGATLQLMILQELACVDYLNLDKKGKPKSPLKSRYGEPDTGVLAKYAEEYARYAPPVWKNILSDRRHMIRYYPYGEGRTIRGPYYYGVVMIDEYYHPIKDTDDLWAVANKLGDDPKYKWKIITSGDSWNQGEYDVQEQKLTRKVKKEYIPKEVDKFSAELSHPSKIIESWRALIKQPINVKPAELLKTLRGANFYTGYPPTGRNHESPQVRRGTDVIDYNKGTEALKGPISGGKWFFDEVRIMGGRRHGQIGFMARSKEDGSFRILG